MAMVMRMMRIQQRWIGIESAVGLIIFVGDT